MVTKRFEKIVNDISEYFSSAWVLLSDTTIYLSNNRKLFHHYENHLRDLRRRLETNKNNPEIIGEVRKEVAEIRKTLRLQGYNLKLGSLDIKVEGFRNDDCASKGFQRCVLYLLADGDILFTIGMSNHIELAETMEARLKAQGYRQVRQKHYLWYKWSNRVLLLSGSATETADDLELFRTYVSENKDYMLKKLRNI